MPKKKRNETREKKEKLIKQQKFHTTNASLALEIHIAELQLFSFWEIKKCYCLLLLLFQVFFLSKSTNVIIYFNNNFIGEVSVADCLYAYIYNTVKIEWWWAAVLDEHTSNEIIKNGNAEKTSKNLNAVQKCVVFLEKKQQICFDYRKSNQMISRKKMLRICYCVWVFLFLNSWMCTCYMDCMRIEMIIIIIHDE